MEERRGKEGVELRSLEREGRETARRTRKGGPTAVTTDLEGVRTGEVRYMPWGEDRYTYGSAADYCRATTMRYTGQRQEAGIGLYFYGARWYDPALGRFTSPDTIIPAQQGVMGNDRYAYTNNNPLSYTDPTGHTPFLVTAGLGAVFGFAANYITQTVSNMQSGMGFNEAVNWSNMDKQQLAVSTVGGFVGGLTLGLTSIAVGAVGLTGNAATASTNIIGGAISNAIGGQAEALTNAAIDQVNNNTSLEFNSEGHGVINFSPNADQFLSDAKNYGFGDSNTFSWDLMIGGGVGFATTCLQGMISDVGTPAAEFITKQPASWIQPLSSVVDFFGELLTQ